MQAVDQSLTMKLTHAGLAGDEDTNERACITSSRANFSDACVGRYENCPALAHHNRWIVEFLRNRWDCPRKNWLLTQHTSSGSAPSS